MIDDTIKKLINYVQWRFAKTMPEIPHEYIVMDWYSGIVKKIISK